MSTLRERTNCFKVVDGEKEGVEILGNGRWLNIVETPEGGARMDVKADDLECLDRLNQKLGKDGRIIEAIVNEAGDEIILVDEEGKQIPFGEIMNAVQGRNNARK